MAILKRQVNVEAGHAKHDPANKPFIVRSANDQMDFASSIEIPRKLFSEFIFESELTILFSSAGVGKTILSYQIADSISRGKQILGFTNESEAQKVLYFDLELSPKQFQGRFVEKAGTGQWINNYQFSDNLFIANFQPHELPKKDEAVEWIITNILSSVKGTNSKVVFIDNISWLATQGLEASRDAGKLMKQLDKLKKEHNLTLIVLAHTPKKRRGERMELMDLAGSASVGNFIDSCFTINWSNYDSDKNSRYIKQVKSRSSETIYHDNNVITCKIEKIYPNFTGIRVIDLELGDEDYLQEDVHLGKRQVADTIIFSEDSRSEILDNCRRTLKEKPEIKSRELGDLLGVSKDTALKYKKMIQDESV